MQYKNGAFYTKPEKIIKPLIANAYNRFKKDYTSFLTARVTVAGRRVGFMVARMVYYLFVEAFDLEDLSWIVICKDTDNLNIKPSNLRKVSLQQKRQRIEERKRYRSRFLDFSETDKKRQRKAIVESISKQVTKYTLQGKKVKTFSSMAEAERATGIFASGIGHVAGGHGVSAEGYIWRFGNDPKVDVVMLKKERRKVYVQENGQKVSQYAFTGKKIADYPSVRDAYDATGAHPNAINKVLKGEYKSAKGFFWQKGYGKDFIDLSDYKWGRTSTAITQAKPVKQYSLEGKYLQTFAGVKIAAKSMGVTVATLSGALNGRQHSCAGYKWKFA